MTPRIDNAFKHAPDAFKAMVALEGAIAQSGLEYGLIELVKMRASQINGCAFCLYMHATDAKKAGESVLRMHLLPGWREATVYSARERAALAWTEALTRVSETHAPDEDYALVEAAFSEKERVYLTFLIGAINVWNRMQIGFRATHPAVEGLREVA